MLSYKIFSNNFIIRLIQIIIFNIILVSFCSLFLFTVILGYEIWLGDVIECSNNEEDDKYYKFPKKPVDAALKIAAEVVLKSVEQVIPNIGAGAAAGTSAVGVLKLTQGLTPAQRLVATGITSFVVATGTQAGLKASTAIAKNVDFNNMIKDFPHSDPDINRVPSPDQNFTIHSPLEKLELNDSPLEIILSSILSINICILLLILILFYLIFSRYLLSSNKDILFKILDTFLLKLRFKEESIERYKQILINGDKYSNLFIFIFFIIVTFLLLFFSLLNIYFISEIKNNLDSYVDVYNYIKNKCGIVQEVNSVKGSIASGSDHLNSIIFIPLSCIVRRVIRIK